MAKVAPVYNDKKELVGYLVNSPAMDIDLVFYTTPGHWTFNGDLDKPTFSPSMLAYANNTHGRDHFFVRDGKIEYLSDCDHELAGKTIDMVDVD